MRGDAERLRRALGRVVRTALAEDRVASDRTTRAVVPPGRRAEGRVVAQAPGVLSGVAAARLAARQMGLTVTRAARDGARIHRGSTVLVLRGDARRLLSSERTVLNFLMHASGVATATQRAVRAASGRRGPEIWGTRKTLPGLRDLEKAAVRHGGGRPHRRDLAAGTLIKNNHLAFVPVGEAVRRARRIVRRGPVQVEVRSSADALAAARAGAPALLIDNRSPRGVRAIVAALERAGLRAGRWIEVSGGITPSTVGRFRGTGADAASLGAITHSAPALPFHLVVRPTR